ncbi:MAG: hypothetical protein ACRD3P_08720 [Terriglobales bacterium]
MNDESKLNRSNGSPQAAWFWLAAAYVSFSAWLLHGVAFRALLISVRELALKFLMKG